MGIIILFFIAGLWMADGLVLIMAPERMIATLRQSIIVAPGFLKWSGLADLSKWGLPAMPGRATRIGRGCWLGMGTLAVLLLIGWAGRAYTIRVPPFGTLLYTVVWYAIGALIVGLFEETIFRGGIFGSLRRCSGYWSAAIVSSLFFAAVHFARPSPPMR